MSIDIQTYFGTDLAKNISILGDFRLRYFKEYPYLYVGTEAEEQKHVAGYSAEPTARLLVATDLEDSGKIVGVAIGTMLSSETDILQQSGEQLQKYGIIPDRCYYFDEMILDSVYRNKAIGKRMLIMLKNAGSKQGANRFCFLAVAREPNDVRQPADYVDSNLIFRKFGFEKTDVSVSFAWDTIQADGSVAKTSNQLNFWIDR
jgi:hypothetical protein